MIVGEKKEAFVFSQLLSAGIQVHTYSLIFFVFEVYCHIIDICLKTHTHTRAAYRISIRYNVVCHFLSINGMLFEGGKYHSGILGTCCSCFAGWRQYGVSRPINNSFCSTRK